MSTASRFIGCKVESLPLKYLGFPLSSKKFSMADWNPMVERVQRQLAFWKEHLLSFAGILTLVKSTLSSIPLYFVSMSSMPT